MPVLEAEFKEILDGIGSWRVRLPLTDPRTAAIQLNRIFKYYREGEGLVFAGYVEEIIQTPDDMLEVKGSSIEVEHVHMNVFQQHRANNVTLSAIMSRFADVVFPDFGWTYTAPATAITLRTDTTTLLTVIRRMAERLNLHFRANITEVAGALVRAMTIAAFGSSSGVTIMKGSPDSEGIDDEDLAYTDRLTIRKSSKELSNWLYPLGAGEGDAQMGLKEAYFSRFTDLVVNGSFERGGSGTTAPTGWTFSAIDGGSVVGRTLGLSIEGDVGAILLGTGTGEEWIEQDITVVAGRTYGVEAWCADASIGAELRVEWRSAVPAVISTDTFPVNAAEITWSGPIGNTTLVAPALAVTARIKLTISTGLIWTAIWDMVRFWRVAAEVGEPYDIWTDTADRLGNFPLLTWGIRDITSITAIGRRIAPLFLKDLAPIESDSAGMIAISEALYDAGAVELPRLLLSEDLYTLGQVYGLVPTVRPGDKALVRWRGVAEMETGAYTPVDVDEELWILERTRRFFDNGTEVSALVVAQADRPPVSTSDEVLLQLEDTTSQWRAQPQATASASEFTIQDQALPITFDYEVTDRTLRVLRVVLDIALGSGPPTLLTITIDGTDRTLEIVGSAATFSADRSDNIARFFIDEETRLVSQGVHTIVIGVTGNAGNATINVSTLSVVQALAHAV